MATLPQPTAPPNRAAGGRLLLIGSGQRRRISMAHPGQASGDQMDSLEIDPDDPRQLAYWAEKLGVSPERLRETVGRVGRRIEAVSRALGGEDQDAGLPGSVTGGPP